MWLRLAALDVPSVASRTAAQAASAPTIPGQDLSGTGFTAGSAVYEKLKENQVTLDCDVDFQSKKRYTSPELGAASYHEWVFRAYGDI